MAGPAPETNRLTTPKSVGARWFVWSWNLPLKSTAFALVDDLDGRRAFMRVYADDDLAHVLPLPDPTMVSTGGQRYFELGIPLWSLSAPR